MGTILAITKSTNCAIKLIACKTTEEAKQKMKSSYEKLCQENSYDCYNTYFDEDSGYAQVVTGFEQVEFRIGELSFI